MVSKVTCVELSEYELALLIEAVNIYMAELSYMKHIETAKRKYNALNSIRAKLEKAKEKVNE